MLSYYNHIIIGCFKDIFQSVDMNNLAALLQALKELNFELTNRASELTAHYSIPLELQQVFAEEGPNFTNAYLNRLTANNTKYSNRGRPRTRGVQHNSIKDSPHQFPGTINSHAGQTFILTLTQIDCTTKLATIIGIDIIGLPYLITHITYAITLIIILAICNVI